MPDSLQRLTEDLGLAPRVAEFFSARKLPHANEYWLHKASYIPSAPGFIFIPVYFDLLIKQHIDVEKLLEEDLLLIMEGILKSAGKLEHKQITHARHVEECRVLLRNAGVLEQNIVRVEQDLVNRAFDKVPAHFRSLRRANTFLYTFAGRKFDFDVLFSSWELIVPLFLMFDDFTDIENDLAERDENCLLDNGSITENFFKLNAVADRLLADVKKLNPTLATYLTGLKSKSIARNMLPILVKGTGQR